ncbi:hypothetical protein GQ53DRAFT_758358 [Thozetella sp. PMI_491]|nr:hypothetical protein GQ53DRAFT_758358 [Thozetella sp. PMI_491]
MHGLTALSVAALAGLTSAWSYPDCEPDNCYREMTDSRFYEEAVAFCPGYLAGKTSVIPSDFENCDSDASKVSSACSCITYSATTSTSSVATSTPATTTTSVVVTTTPASSSPATSTATSAPVSSPPPTSTGVSSKTEGHSSYPHSTKMTTSTITSTHTYTITSCKPEVTNCPGNKDHPYTTVETTVYTTVCPVTETPTQNGTWVPPPGSKTTVGTVTTGKTTTTSTPTSVVHAGAAQNGVGLAAVAAGLVAMLL